MKFATITGTLCCDGKQQFMTREEAAQRISQKLRKLVKPYHCAICSYWHNGSSENHRRKTLARKEKRRKKLEIAEVYDERNHQ